MFRIKRLNENNMSKVSSLVNDYLFITEGFSLTKHKKDDKENKDSVTRKQYNDSKDPKKVLKDVGKFGAIGLAGGALAAGAKHYYNNK